MSNYDTRADERRKVLDVLPPIEEGRCPSTYMPHRFSIERCCRDTGHVGVHRSGWDGRDYQWRDDG